MQFRFKSFTIVFLLFCSAQISSAQLLDNSSGKAFTDQPYFNEKIIKKNKIKTISGGFIHYKLGDILRETDYFRQYTFNENGQLRSEEHTSELQSRPHLVCRLLLEKKNKETMTGSIPH